MAGVNATWSSRVTMGLIEACRERDMSFGYIEFLGRDGWLVTLTGCMLGWHGSFTDKLKTWSSRIITLRWYQMCVGGFFWLWMLNLHGTKGFSLSTLGMFLKKNIQKIRYWIAVRLLSKSGRSNLFVQYMLTRCLFQFLVSGLCFGYSRRNFKNTFYHGNPPQPSFLGVINPYIGGVKSSCFILICWCSCFSFFI